MNTMQNPVSHSEKLASGLITAVVALSLEAFLWGFTVDDAWIVSRVASHGAETGVFAFNSGGPVTDAVTPFGFAHVLGWLGDWWGLRDPLEFWTLARWLGCAAYGVSFFAAGYFSTSRMNWREWWRAPLLTLLSVPAAIWAGAGLTAPLVGLFVLLGSRALEVESPGRSWRRKVGAVTLGAAAAWRPELFPFALAVLICGPVFHRRALADRILNAAILAAPTFAVMSFRWLSFGHPLPLSSVAKTPSFESGLYYAAVTLVWAGLPWLLTLRSSEGVYRRSDLVPWFVHIASLVFVGGDWMPGLRLSAALFPWLVWRVVPRLTKRWHGALLLGVAVFPAMLLYNQGEDLRSVTSRRLALIEQVRPMLENARVVATVDIGWLGVATEAQIVDLAGVTDPKIAALPGGHTSKAIYPGLFSGRNVDTWVIRTLDSGYRKGEPVETIQAAYWVDARLLNRSANLGMQIEEFLPLQGTQGGYVVLRLKDKEEQKAAF